VSLPAKKRVSFFLSPFRRKAGGIHKHSFAKKREREEKKTKGMKKKKERKTIII